MTNSLQKSESLNVSRDFEEIQGVTARRISSQLTKPS